MGLCMSCKSGKRKKADGNEGEVGSENGVATQGNGMPSPLKGVKIHPPRHANGSPLTTKNGGPTSFPNNSQYSPDDVSDVGANGNVANLHQVGVQLGKSPESGDITFYDNLNQKQQNGEIEKQASRSAEIAEEKQHNGEARHRNLKINGSVPQNVEKPQRYVDGHMPNMAQHVENEMEINNVQEEINKISYELRHDEIDHDSEMDAKVGKNLRSVISVNNNHDIGKGDIKFVDANENEKDSHNPPLGTHKMPESDTSSSNAFRGEAISTPGFKILRSEKVDFNSPPNHQHNHKIEETDFFNETHSVKPSGIAISKNKNMENLSGCAASTRAGSGASGAASESWDHYEITPQIPDSLSYAGDPTTPYSTNSTIGTKYKVGTGTTFGVALPTGQSESSVMKEATPTTALGCLSHTNMGGGAPYLTNNVRDARSKFEKNAFAGAAKAREDSENSTRNEPKPPATTLGVFDNDKTSAHSNTATIRSRFFESGNCENRNGGSVRANDEIKFDAGGHNEKAPKYAPRNSTNSTTDIGGYNSDAAGIKPIKQNTDNDFRIKDFASKIEMFNNSNNSNNFVRGVHQNETSHGKEDRDSQINKNVQNSTAGNFRTSITLTTRSKQQAGAENLCDHSTSIAKYENQNQNLSTTGNKRSAWNNSLFLGDQKKQFPVKSNVLPPTDQSFQDRFKIDNYEELQKIHETPIDSKLKSGNQFPVSNKKQPNSSWSERVASEAREVGVKIDEKMPNGGIYHESFHRAIDRNATRPGPISTTNQNIQLPDRHTFRQQVLEAHNKHRARHGAPPLRLSDSLNQQAQIWADKGAKAGQLERQPDDPNSPRFGENLWSVTASGPTPISGEYPVQTWYEEGVFYDYKRPVYSGTNHFTQLLWKSSREIGVGVAISTDERHAYVVCNYTPTGNTGGGYRENVLPLI